MTAAVEADVFMSYVATGNIWNPQKLRDTKRMTLICTNMIMEHSCTERGGIMHHSQHPKSWQSSLMYSQLYCANVSTHNLG